MHLLTSVGRVLCLTWRDVSGHRRQQKQWVSKVVVLHTETTDLAVYDERLLSLKGSYTNIRRQKKHHPLTTREDNSCTGGNGIALQFVLIFSSCTDRLLQTKTTILEPEPRPIFKCYNKLADLQKSKHSKVTPLLARTTVYSALI